MRTYHYIILAVVIIIGLGASFLLIPHERQLALMQFKGRNYEVARQAYEQLSKAGDLSASVVMPLTELYLQYGDVKEAVALMERFVRTNPHNIEARRRLGTYYQYAQRPHDYLLNLEQISRLQSSEENLRELSDAYNFTAQYPKQIDALRALLKRHPENPKDFLDLASLQAAQGLIVDAATTVQQLETRHPNALDSDSVEFLLSLMLDSGHSDPALERASSWLSKRPDPETATRFAALFHFKGHAVLALRLLQPFEKYADNHPHLLAQLIQLQIANGRQDQAFARLHKLYSSGQLPEPVVESYIDLALARHHVALAFKVAEGIDLSLLPDWLLFNLAEAALAANRKDFTQLMVKKIGEGFLEARPVLAAEMALARGDKTSATHWISRAEGNAHLSLEEKVALAGIYAKVGRQKEAMDLLLQLTSLEKTPDTALAELARMYLDQGKAVEGLRLFEQLRLRRSSPQVEAAWALLAASAERAEEVIAWMNRTPEEKLSDQFLTDLYFVANDTRKPALALVTAHRLFRRRGGRSDRLHLANALVSAGRPNEALPHLRSLLPGSLEEEEAYVVALSAASVKGAPVADELRGFLAQKLAQPNLASGRRRELAYALLDLKAYETVLPALADLAREEGDSWLFAYVEASGKTGRKKELVAFLKREMERKDLSIQAKETRLYALIEQGGEAVALPYLRTFAEVPGGDWVFAYENALRKLGRRDELVSFWKARVARPDLSIVEKRSLAYGLLEAGEKRLAQEVFLELARNAPPDSRDVAQLLFLRGPRPAKPALDWLVNRARSASGRDQAGWLNHLVNAGAAQRATALMKDNLPPPGSGSIVFDAYLSALVASRDSAGFAAAVDHEMTVENDAERLRRFARFALQVEHASTAQKAYGKLLSLAGNDREALKWLGSWAFANANYSPARDYLSRFLALGEGDYEVHFLYGELLRRENNRAGARKYYERALQQIEQDSAKPFVVRITWAQLLHRVGRTEESFAAFKELLKEKPSHKSLQAEFVATLLEAGRYEEAQQVLSTPQAQTVTRASVK